jgi:hypothetical protein
MGVWRVMAEGISVDFALGHMISKQAGSSARNNVAWWRENGAFVKQGLDLS